MAADEALSVRSARSVRVQQNESAGHGGENTNWELWDGPGLLSQGHRAPRLSGLRLLVYLQASFKRMMFKSPRSFGVMGPCGCAPCWQNTFWNLPAFRFIWLLARRPPIFNRHRNERSLPFHSSWVPSPWRIPRCCCFQSPFWRFLRLSDAANAETHWSQNRPAVDGFLFLFPPLSP